METRVMAQAASIPPVWLGPVGTSAPASVWPQERIVELGVIAAGDEARRGRVRSVFSRTGVDQRALVVTDDAGPWFYHGKPLPTTGQRMRLYEEAALDLAVAASRASLDASAIAPSDVTHIVSASCTGFSAPGVDIGLIDRLALMRSTQRSHIGFMGCHAAINALRVASAIAAQDASACVLVCCAEVCSIHLQHADTPERDIVNALFADGSAACVVSQQQPQNAIGRIVATSSMLWPGTADLMRWAIGDHGFEMVLGRDVPKAIRENTRPWLAAWLAASGTDLEHIDAWAIHPGGPHIIDAVAEALTLKPDEAAASRAVLAGHGNMSSATLLFVIARIQQQQRFSRLVATAFGPGLAGEALYLEQ